jgi:hypothetical protein
VTPRYCIPRNPDGLPGEINADVSVTMTNDLTGIEALAAANLQNSLITEPLTREILTQVGIGYFVAHRPGVLPCGAQATWVLIPKRLSLLL